MSPRELLAWNVKKLRVLKGLSQERLSLEANLERVAISQIERKQINPGLDSLGKIAEALDVPITDLFKEPLTGELEPMNLRPGRRNSI
ncbi:helix-turn-helix domain-containing protein [Agrobacterium tumefaciens]|uniref:helix-turn-helix domain-containing protein n=1 Tax=Agrobacterium tumefaciens TaxID=358 RepID=UPI0009781F2E|nr:transcriptional regulator [Agrobacterium tumefaciens]